MARKALEWGETPWDDMPREKLVREMQRAYAAANAARSVLSILAVHTDSIFWQPGGSGYRARVMCDAVVEPVERRFGGESVYRCFFHYAVDLLFRPGLGCGWIVCPEGHMVGTDDESPIETICPMPSCGKTARPLAWRHLKPKKRRTSATGGGDRG